MTGYEIVSFKDLKEKYGHPYCRTHTDRLEDPEDPCYDATFPKSFKLGKGRGGRRVWLVKAYIAWIALKAKG